MRGGLQPNQSQNLRTVLVALTDCKRERSNRGQSRRGSKDIVKDDMKKLGLKVEEMTK